MKNLGGNRDAKLANIGESAEDLFDFAKNNQWRKADEFVSRMRSSYSSVNNDPGQGLI